MWELPKIDNLFLGVPTLRIIVFGVYNGVSLFLGNYFLVNVYVGLFTGT